MHIDNSKSKIEIYCDGSSSKKYGHGSFAAYIKLSEDKIYNIARPFTDVTNNQMELMGFIHPMVDVLHKLKNSNLEGSNVTIKVTSDSQYLVKGINEWIYTWRKNGWRNSSGKKLPNLELWKIVHYIVFELPNKSGFRYNIDLNWTKGHVSKEIINVSQDAYYNDLCDRLASSITEDMQDGVDYSIESHILKIKEIIGNFEK